MPRSFAVALLLLLSAAPLAAQDDYASAYIADDETPNAVQATWEMPEPLAVQATLPQEPAAADSRLPLTLAPRKQPEERTSLTGGGAKTGMVTGTLGALAVVLGLVLLIAWFLRRSMPRGLGALPNEVVEVLGRAPLMGKQTMHLVRLGNKLLLISITPAGAETLGEVEHPDEVQRLIALCRQGQPGSISAGFREVLAQFEQQPTTGGFFGTDTSASTSRRRLA